jgi:hypothetical protein
MNQELPTALRLGGSPSKKKRLSWQMQKRKWQYQVLSAFRKVCVCRQTESRGSFIDSLVLGCIPTATGCARRRVRAE